MIYEEKKQFWFFSKSTIGKKNVSKLLEDYVPAITK